MRLSATNVTFKKAQAELGDTATPFERRFPTIELALCLRYYELIPFTTHPTTIYQAAGFSARKRTAPTLSLASGSLNSATIALMALGDQTWGIRQTANAVAASDALMAASAEL